MTASTLLTRNGSQGIAASTSTPVAEGFRMPAEWEAQAAIWLSWPIRELTWPNGHYAGIPEKFAEIVATISRYQQVNVNVTARFREQALSLIRAAGADLAKVALFDHLNNDAWCRDHGPIFVKNDRTGEVALTDWDFNAWGGKIHPFDDDDAMPSRIAAKLGLRRFVPGIVLEGGSIDVNGRGELLTTEVCLLNHNRNPQLTRAEIEAKLRENLGVTTIHWLGDGIAGDDTDGHVDDITRFIDADSIVTAVEADTTDVNYPPLHENLERLRSLRRPDGGRYRLVELPMPEACVTDGIRLPASYANFLIMNRAVIVPVFGQPRRDAEALEILRGCFPGREVVGIDCRQWVIGRGTLHCITQQQPA
jgi:agmatine deiminase